MKAIQLSLNEADRDVIVSRITSDYMTDVGAIGMLRQRWLETAIMQGTVKAQPLPAVVIEDVRRLHAAASELGPVRLEWVHDGERAWVVQMHRGATVSAAGVLVPGEARHWTPFEVANGLL